jgi:hypothetical protein
MRRIEYDKELNPLSMTNMTISHFLSKNKKIKGTALPQVGPAATEATATAAATTPPTPAVEAEATVEGATVECHCLVGCYQGI